MLKDTRNRIPGIFDFVSISRIMKNQEFKKKIKGIRKVLRFAEVSKSTAIRMDYTVLC